MQIIITPRLTAYFEQIETECGHPIRIELVDSLASGTVPAVYIFDSGAIVVRLAADRLEQGASLEQTLAHEVTHGYLRFAKGYIQACGNKEAHATVHTAFVLLGSMIEDLVVNRICEEHGFKGDKTNYMRNIKFEINELRSGRNPYEKYNYNRNVLTVFMIFRYILAWGNQQYSQLSEQEAELIKTFLKTFEEARPDEFGAALEVRNVIETNDIFTPDGYRSALEKIVKMWDLEGFVEYKRVDSNRHGIRP